MTLPISGDISINNINVELGLPSTAQIDLSFINNLVLPAQRPSDPNVDSYRGKAYFQNNTAGNCNNGNEVNCACDAGDINCGNCTNCNAINCANCDTQPWLQTNCNCVTAPYNCNMNPTTINCNCDCGG
jgi:hypothetical protein